MQRFKYKSCGASDIGTVKEVNQDSLYRKNAKYNGDFLLFAMVADGMGGLDAGEIASKTLTDNFDDWFLHGGLEKALDSDILRFDEELQKSIGSIISRSNDEMNDYGREHKMITGSTATMILLYNGTYYAANIGDSRIYRLTKGALYQVTIDHSWIQQQLDLGYTEEDILDDPQYDDLCNRITRCVGAGTDYAYADYFSNDYIAGDMFLLCSDGLIHENTVDEITSILMDEKLDLDDKIEILIDNAKDRGEEDNITAILIEVFEDDSTPAKVRQRKKDNDKEDVSDPENKTQSLKGDDRVTQTLK